MSSTNAKMEITSSNKGPGTNRPLKDSIYRETNQYNHGYMDFYEKVDRCPYLVQIGEPVEPVSLLKKTQKKKKEIVSYKANRDELFIEKPKRPPMPIDIKGNLEENLPKPVTADLGIQSDEINYENPIKDFLPKKIGIDKGTQIEDTDLFEFNREVMPLLTVIVGKTLEQSLNELSQEDELENLRKAKDLYMKKNVEDDNRIRNLEDREIQRKFNNDSKKEKRMAERETRKKTQKMMICRVTSKYYLNQIMKFSKEDLLTRGQFRKYEGITVKDKSNRIIKENSEKLSSMFCNLREYIDDTLQKQYKRNFTKHNKAVAEHREYVKRMKEEAERRKKEEEERKRKEEEDRKERRRQRKINRIGNEIKEDLIKVGIEKSDVLGEEFNEMDNHFVTGTPYIGIYGGYMGMLLVAFSLCKKEYMQIESLYSQENISDCLANIFNEIQGTFNLYFTMEAGAKIKEILKRTTTSHGNVDDDEEEEKNEDDGINLNDLKSQSDLEPSTWEKIGEVLSDIENNSDYLLKNFIEEFSQATTGIDPTTNEEYQIDPYINTEFYGLIIKGLIDLCIKANFLERFNFVFEEPKKQETEEEENKNEEGEQQIKKVSYQDIKNLPFEEKLNKYEAVCMIEMNKPGSEIISVADFLRSPSKKKAVTAPDLDNVPYPKAYNNVSDRHYVLLFDRVAEFILRNKIFESILAQNAFTIGQEIDSEPMFKGFNENYDQMIAGSNLNKLIQVYHYPPEEEKKDEEGEEEQQD